MVRQYAIGLTDKGDGHGADWPVVAQMLFYAAFGTADEALADPRMRTVLRRVEAGLYNRLADNGHGDDGLPMSLATASPTDVRKAPEPHLPEPRLKP